MLSIYLFVYHYYFNVMHTELLQLVIDMEIEKKYYESPEYDGCMDHECMNSDIERYTAYKKQYERFGFDDTVAWSLDYAFGKWFAPRLERYCELSSKSIVQTKEQVNDYAEMVEGFSLLGSDEYDSLDKTHATKVQKAFDLLAKHYKGLWY